MLTTSSSRPTSRIIASETLGIAEASLLASETSAVPDIAQDTSLQVRVLEGGEPLSDQIMDFVLRKNEELYRRLA